jgi:hypothetical protein
MHAERAAEGERPGIGEFAFVLDLFAFEADVGDPVLAAAVGAAGDVQLSCWSKPGRRPSISSTSQRAKPLVSVIASLQNSVPCRQRRRARNWWLRRSSRAAQSCAAQRQIGLWHVGENEILHDGGADFTLAYFSARSAMASSCSPLMRPLSTVAPTE